MSDDAVLSDALHDLGIPADVVDWRSETPWDAYDVVVVRSAWNYHDHHTDFVAWIDEVASTSELMNPPDVMEANTRKTYLRTLEEAGVPIVPTQWITHGDPVYFPDGGDVVIKPSVGATASGLRRFTSPEGVSEHVDSLLHLGDVLVQPFMRSVAEIGETSLVFVAGQYSHAVHKVAEEGEFRVQSEFGGSYGLTAASPESIVLAERAIEALSNGHADLAYARVDLVLDDGGSPIVSEVELVEPDLFFALKPDAAHRLAEYVASRLAPSIRDPEPSSGG